MGNRDRPSRNVKKPKKKNEDAPKPIAAATMTALTPMPDLVRKKKRRDLDEGGK